MNRQLGPSHGETIAWYSRTRTIAARRGMDSNMRPTTVDRGRRFHAGATFARAIGAIASGLRPADIFEGTVAENIDLQRPGVRAKDVRNALAAVGLLDDILRLENGIETQINASGSEFSSTQLRLLMLARAW